MVDLDVVNLRRMQHRVFRGVIFDESVDVNYRYLVKKRFEFLVKLFAAEHQGHLTCQVRLGQFAGKEWPNHRFPRMNIFINNRP